MNKPVLEENIRPTLVVFQDGCIHSYEKFFHLIGEQATSSNAIPPKG